MKILLILAIAIMINIVNSASGLGVQPISLNLTAGKCYNVEIRLWNPGDEELNVTVYPLSTFNITCDWCNKTITLKPKTNRTHGYVSNFVKVCENKEGTYYLMVTPLTNATIAPSFQIKFNVIKEKSYELPILPIILFGLIIAGLIILFKFLL